MFWVNKEYKFDLSCQQVLQHVDWLAGILHRNSRNAPCYVKIAQNTVAKEIKRQLSVAGEAMAKVEKN